MPHSAGTPNAKGLVGAIGDYAPSEAPMVPAIIVHCINEVLIRTLSYYFIQFMQRITISSLQIEKRGLTEVGIYRVSGSEREIKSLKVSSLPIGIGRPLSVHIKISFVFRNVSFAVKLFLFSAKLIFTCCVAALKISFVIYANHSFQRFCGRTFVTPPKVHHSKSRFVKCMQPLTSCHNRIEILWPSFCCISCGKCEHWRIYFTVLV